jgi:hypothetical protein
MLLAESRSAGWGQSFNLQFVHDFLLLLQLPFKLRQLLELVLQHNQLPASKGTEAAFFSVGCTCCQLQPCRPAVVLQQRYALNSVQKSSIALERVTPATA